MHKLVFSLHSNACLRNNKSGSTLKLLQNPELIPLSRFLIMLLTSQPTKYFFFNLCNPKVYHSVHKNTPHVPILSRNNSDHDLSLIFKKHFNIILSCSFISSKWSLFQDSHQNMCHMPLLPIHSSYKYSRRVDNIYKDCRLGFWMNVKR